MTDELVAVSCLNGEIEVGDSVAYAVGNARNGSGMRLGFVKAIKGPDTITVTVTASSGGTGCQWEIIDGRYHYHFEPYDKTISYLDRVVKVAS
jgi:hypothetical protein